MSPLLSAETTSANKAPLGVAVVSSVSNLFDSVTKISLAINEPTGAIALIPVQSTIGLDGPYGGFDLKRPAALVLVNEENGYLVLPVKSWKALKLHFVKEKDSLEKLDNGILKLNLNDTPVFLRRIEKENLLLVSNTESVLPDSISPEVAEKIDSLSKTYLLGLSASTVGVGVDNVIKLLEKGESKILEAIQNNDDIDELAADILKSLNHNAFQALKDLTKDNPCSEIGLLLKDESLVFNAKLNVKPNSNSAKFFNSAKNIKTNLAGFFDPKAPFAWQMAGKANVLSDKQVEQLSSMIIDAISDKIDDQIEDPKAAQAAQKLLPDFKTILRENFQEGNLDCAGTVDVSKENGLSITVARWLVDAGKVESLAAKVIKAGAENGCKCMVPVKNGLKTNIAKVNGVNIHTVTLKVSELCPDDTDTDIQLFSNYFKSDKLVIAFGFGKNIVCWSLGKNAVENLTKAIKASAQPSKAPVLVINSQVLPFIKFQNDILARSGQFKEEDINRFKKLMGSTYDSTENNHFEISGIEDGILIESIVPFSILKANYQYYGKFVPTLEPVFDLDDSNEEEIDDSDDSDDSDEEESDDSDEEDPFE